MWEGKFYCVGRVTMSECQLRLNSEGFLQCPDCDWIYKLKSEKLPRRPCPKSPALTEAAEKLGITGDDIKHWAQALARWRLAEFPVRSQAEIERIETTICQPCDEYVADDAAWIGKLVGWLTGKRYGRCKKCGCGLSTSRLAVANKIAMATESCKLGNWGSPEQPIRPE